MAATNDDIGILTHKKTQRASEEVYSRLRSQILAGKFKPGDSLPSERSMMDSLKRSRPTIREALRMLERAGLIKSFHGRDGAVVLSPGVDSIVQPLEDIISMRKTSEAELLEVRELVEIAVAQWAALRYKDGDGENLLRTLIAVRDAVDSDSFFEADIRFHHALATATQNSLCEAMHSALFQLVFEILTTNFFRLTFQRQGELRQEIIHDHQAIYDAVIAGDAEAAGERMREHVRSFEALINGK